jgi:hypothetical protein
MYVSKYVLTTSRSSKDANSSQWAGHSEHLMPSGMAAIWAAERPGFLSRKAGTEMICRKAAVISYVESLSTAICSLMKMK